MADDELLFADADAALDDADYVIFGAPFDQTVSHRSGTSGAPASIRKESYNFETYLYEYDIDLTTIAIHDAGDLPEQPNVRSALEKVFQFTKQLKIKNKFPVMLGGEHSLTLGAVKGISALSQDDDLPTAVLVLDAHLDYRREYESERFSHACITRRLAEVVGTKNVVPIGIRSMSGEEHRDALTDDLKYYDMATVNEMGMKTLLEDVMDELGEARLYLSVDMDVLDPAYAPGVGNPEPYGLKPQDIKTCIEVIASKLVGFDIMELSPPYDNGNTAALAGRFVRSLIALRSR